MALLYRCTHHFFRLWFKLLYGHKVYGEENLVEGAAIIAPNHASFYDPPLITASTPRSIHYLARASLFEKPILKWLIPRLQGHPIGGAAQDLASFKLIGKLLKEGNLVVIFPEGIRTWDGGINDLSHGVAMLALRNDCPIIPLSIEGSYECWPRTQRFPSLHGKTACRFGKPIYPSEFAHLDKKSAQKAMTEKLQQELQALSQAL